MKLQSRSWCEQNKVLICFALLMGFDHNLLYVCLIKQIYVPLLLWSLHPGHKA